MRHQVDHRKLGRHTSHRHALLKNMATSLILHERIHTTVPKAKELRRLADQLVTMAKAGDLHRRRLAARYIHDHEALRKLFSTLAERFKERKGGYTRIYRDGTRVGDAAEMAYIEYLGYQLPPLKKEDEDEESHDHDEEGGEKKKKGWNLFGKKKKKKDAE